MIFNIKLSVCFILYLCTMSVRPSACLRSVCLYARTNRMITQRNHYKSSLEKRCRHSPPSCTELKTSALKPYLVSSSLLFCFYSCQIHCSGSLATSDERSKPQPTCALSELGSEVAAACRAPRGWSSRCNCSSRVAWDESTNRPHH